VEVERTSSGTTTTTYSRSPSGLSHADRHWNTAFHHGSWLQTTIARPEMVRFGGTFIPCILWVPGGREYSIGRSGAGYSAGVGNGADRPSAVRILSITMTTARGWRILLAVRQALWITDGSVCVRDKIKPLLCGRGMERISANDYGRAILSTRRKAGILAIRKRSSSATFYEFCHQQSGVLRAGWLPASLAGESAEAVLPIRTYHMPLSEQV